MHRSESYPSPFRLNQWLVQPDLNRIDGPEGATGVEPRVMKVLLVLAEHPGEVVARDDLLDEVWGDAVVGEESLTRAVSELRRIFGDNARRPDYIETIRQHGYRLIAPVTPAPAAEPTQAEPVPETPSAPLPPTGKQPATAGRAMGIPRSVFLLAACLVLAGLVFAPRLFRNGTSDDAAEVVGTAPSSAVPLTSLPGRELYPALSPDGTRVAFIWAGPDGDNADLYIKQQNSETPLRLTEDPGWAAWPTWSPDGQTLAFVQGADTASLISLVSSLGGAVREVHRVADHQLWTLSLDNFEVRSLAIGSDDHTGMYQPRYSPDGTRVAWIGLDPVGASGLFTAPAGGGRARRITHGPAPMQGLAWTPDARFLVYASSPAGRFTLWKVPADGGSPGWIPTPGDFSWNPAIARETGDLVFEQVRMDQDLWRVQILGRSPWQLGTGPFIASTRWENEADFHPAGDKVVFVSARSGFPELWQSDENGENLHQVTTLRAAALNNPRWAPGGDRIAFNVVTEGVSRVMIVQSLGGPPKEVVGPGGMAVFTNWSADGHTLLVGMDQGEGWQVHRLDPGSGELEPLTRDGGLGAAEDPGGRVLYFTRPNESGLWMAALEDGRPVGEIRRLLPDLAHEDRRHWRLVSGTGGVTGIAYVTRAAGEAILAFYDMSDETSSFLTDLPGLAASGLAVSPAGDVILYARTQNVAGDLMLIRTPTP